MLFKEKILSNLHLSSVSFCVVYEKGKYNIATRNSRFYPLIMQLVTRNSQFYLLKMQLVTRNSQLAVSKTTLSMGLKIPMKT